MSEKRRLIKQLTEINRQQQDEYEKCEKSKRWTWMMDYCKLHELNPAQKWAWDRAGRAYKQVKAEAIKRGSALRGRRIEL